MDIGAPNLSAKGLKSEGFFQISEILAQKDGLMIISRYYSFKIHLHFWKTWFIIELLWWRLRSKNVNFLFLNRSILEHSRQTVPDGLGQTCPYLSWVIGQKVNLVNLFSLWRMLIQILKTETIYWLRRFVNVGDAVSWWHALWWWQQHSWDCHHHENSIN